MDQLTRQRDQATQRTRVYEGDIHTLREQLERLTTANKNGERMLIHVLHHRNEAWSEEDIMRTRQVELEQ
jgi:hypothetical protein